MKIIKARYDLLIFFLLPFTTITIFLYFFSFNQFTHLAIISWILTFIVVAFAFFPKAAKPLGDEVEASGFLKWIAALFLSQLIINLFLWSFAKIINYDLAKNVYHMQFNLISFVFASGVFPWGFMILTALTWGYFTYCKKELGLLSSAMRPLYKNTHLDSIGVAIDSYMRLIPFFLIVFIFTLLALSLILLTRQWIDFPLTVGLKFQVVFISCVLFFLLSQPLWIQFLHKLMYYGVPTAAIMLGFIILISLVYPLLNLVSHWLLSLNPLLDVSYRIVNPQYIPMHILILVTFWGFALSAINGAYVAYLSQNKTMRQMIFYSFTTNLVGWFIIAILEKSSGQITIPLITMMLCNIILILVMLHKKYFTYFFRATLPTEKPIKIRSAFRFVKIMPLTVASALCIYFGMGVASWSFLTVLALLPPIVIIFMSYIGWMKG